MVFFHHLKILKKKQTEEQNREQSKIQTEEQIREQSEKNVFKRIYNTFDESVKNKLTTKGDNKRIATIALQHFLQDIVNKRFNSGNDARNWIVKNILYNYERGVRNVDSNKAKKNNGYLRGGERNFYSSCSINS